MDLESEVRRAQNELELLRFSRQERLEDSTKQQEAMSAAYEEQKRQFRLREEAVKTQAKLHEYVEALQNASGEQNIESQYIIALEAQVCRATHHMNAWSAQLQILKGELDDLSARFYQCLVQAQEEKCYVECQLNDAISAMQQQKDSQGERYTKILEEQKEQILRYRQFLSVDETPEQETQTPKPTKSRKLKAFVLLPAAFIRMSALPLSLKKEGRSEDSGDSLHANGLNEKLPLVGVQFPSRRLEIETKVAKVA